MPSFGEKRNMACGTLELPKPSLASLCEHFEKLRAPVANVLQSLW